MTSAQLLQNLSTSKTLWLFLKELISKNQIMIRLLPRELLENVSLN